MTGVLVAGIGNIFLGDDGFGVEVAARLQQRALPAGVQVRDLGIRGIDLAYALTSGIDAAILVDAMARGKAPGTLYLVAPPVGSAGNDPMPGGGAHQLDPASVLRLAQSLGQACGRVLVVGCEPQTFGTENDEPGRIGLSEPVAAAVDGAVELVIAVARALQSHADLPQMEPWNRSTP